MISLPEVAKLAQLARIEVAPAEQEKLRQDLSKILDYVSELKEASSTASDAAVASAPVNVWREDSQVNIGGEQREKLLAAAPKRQGDYFKVKKILG